MRLPSISLPSLSFGDRFDGAQTRRVVLYGLYTLVLFCVFMIDRFPYRVLVDRALHQVDTSPLRIEYSDVDFAWWRGLRLQGVQLINTDVGRQPLLEVARSYVHPDWAGLLKGRVSGAQLDADTYGGKMEWRWSAGEKVSRGQGKIDRVQVAQHRALAALFEQGEISGLLSGIVDIEVRNGESDAAKVEGQLRLDDLAAADLIYAGTPLLNLGFDEVVLKFSLQGGRLEVEELNATGPDLTIAASGQIGLRRPVQDSVLNLRASVAATDKARPEVKGLVSLLPRPKGGRANAPIPITGTLAKPRIR